MANNVDINTELEIIPPHSKNYIRSVTNILANQLKDADEASLEVPTLLSRAKTLVNQKNYIALYTTRESE